MNANRNPEIGYCECGRPEPPACVECGELSHSVIKTAAGGWRLVPIAHPDCNEGLGWLPAKDCPVCDGSEDAAAREAWGDYRYGAGNHA